MVVRGDTGNVTAGGTRQNPPERLRESGVLSSYRADGAVGVTLNQLMFRNGITRKQLGEALGITGPAAGRKLRGEIGWSLTDLFIAADFFHIEVTEL